MKYTRALLFSQPGTLWHVQWHLLNEWMDGKPLWADISRAWSTACYKHPSCSHSTVMLILSDFNVWIGVEPTSVVRERAIWANVLLSPSRNTWSFSTRRSPFSPDLSLPCTLWIHRTWFFPSQASQARIFLLPDNVPRSFHCIEHDWSLVCKAIPRCAWHLDSLSLCLLVKMQFLYVFLAWERTPPLALIVEGDIKS